MKKILFIGGSVNQTSMVHAVAGHLAGEYDCYFTPYYGDTPLVRFGIRAGLLDFTVLGGNFKRQTEAYLASHNLPVDFGGRSHLYDLVVTTSDILIQNNIRGKKIVLIQEGMTDPENFMTHLIRHYGLPRWMAINTSTTGMSNAYTVFCVASEGYRRLFVEKGAGPEKIVVTGIPGFDNAVRFLNNTFPFRDYVLAATSDLRETKRPDNRSAFIREVLKIASGRPVIFKLHPNENTVRAANEIKNLAPGALIFSNGEAGEMIANCKSLVTQYSTLSYIGLALGKEVYSYLDVGQLRELLPQQNGGKSGKNIAAICRQLLEE